MNFDAFMKTLKDDEGFRSTVYLDTEGRLTVGYGLCVDEAVPGAGIAQDEAEMIARMRARKLLRAVGAAVAGFDDLPEPVQRALVNMAYQMGVEGLLGFKMMLTAIAVGDYATAADEGLDSKWARQTPNRAKKVTDLIRSAA
jgi:lysozyme